MVKKMIIRDACTNRSMGVDEEGFGKVASTVRPLQHHANAVFLNAYSALISVTPTGAGDCFFYIKNDDVLNLVIRSITLYGASAESVQVKLGDTGTVGGTHAALVPVSRNAGSGKVADATCESGVDITGLSGGSIVDLVQFTNSWMKVRWDSSLIVPKNTLLSLYAVTGAVAINANLSFLFLADE
jgi:hypothetical protein